MGSEDFVEPAFAGGGIFGRENFNNVAVLELGVEAAHFAVDFDTGNVSADFGVEAVGEVKREGTVRQIDDVTFRGVNEDFVGEKVELELFEVDFFAFAELGGGGLELGNPEEGSREMLDFAGAVVFGELLFVVVEAGGEAMFGVFMHLFSANLKFDDLLIFGDDGGVNRLIAVLFRHGDVIFDASGHRGIERMDESESKIAVGDVVDDNAKGGKIVNFAHVLIVFSEFFVEAVNRFNAATDFEFELFAAEDFGNFGGNFAQSFFGGASMFVD